MSIELPFTFDGTFTDAVTPPPLPTAFLDRPDRAPSHLEFTRNLGGVLQDKVIGALSAPLPSTDPMSAYRYLRSRRQTIIDSVKQRPLVRMQDKNLNQLATIGQEMSCRFEEIAADSGEAAVVIRGGDYLSDFVRKAVRIEEDLHLSIDPFATKRNWRYRWGGKITTINIKRDVSGIHTVELIATANREHLKTTLVGSTPLFPPEFQPIKMWMLPANIRTGCAVTLFINWLRAFFPSASVATNIFNPLGWINPFGPDALLNFDPLEWPMQVQFINPFLDQSRTSLIAAAWSDFHSATVDPLRDAGCTARVYTWFEEDEDSPHPELEALVGRDLASLARPKRNCIIAAFEDHSGYAGPTGTFIDGPINLFASTLDDLITTTVFPVDADEDGEIDPVFRKLFLVAPPKPILGWRDGQHSGIIESGYHMHKGPVKTTMVYGPSPKLVNDLQTFAIRYAISQIAQAVILAGELPAVEGLDNLYQRPMASWTTSCFQACVTQTRCAPYSPATSATSNTANKAKAPPTPCPVSSPCGRGIGRNAPTARSRSASVTPPRTSSCSTRPLMSGRGLRSTASSTSTKSRRSSTSTTATRRSRGACRLAMKPGTGIRSRRASGRCRPCTR